MADAGSSFVVKFECGDDRRRVRLSELSYEALQQAASEAYADMPEVQAFDLKYRDEDGDFCTLTPSTFVDFLDVTGSLATKLLRLTPRCPAPSVTTTPRVAAPPPCATLDATAALQDREGLLDACAFGRLHAAGAAAGAAAEVESSARAEASPRSSRAASPSSSSSSSSSSESSCASSCTRRLEDAKQACLAAKQAWKEARQHYKNEVKAVRQSMKQAKKEWKREQKEKAKAMKRRGQRFSMPDQELQYTNNSHYDEFVPLVAAPWPDGAEMGIEEASDDGFTWPRPFKPMKAPLDPADAPEEGRPAAEDQQQPPPAAAEGEDPRPSAEEERHQPEPERPAAKDDKDDPRGRPADDKDDKDDKEKSNLEILKEMGFYDMELNAQLLKSNNDDVAAVLNILFGG